MSTPKLGSMASAGLYFCGTAMLAAAILLIPFVYKPATTPCECPPVPSAPAVSVPVAPPIPVPTAQPVPPVPTPPEVVPAAAHGGSEASGAESMDTSAAQPASGASSGQSPWRFEFGTELRLDEAQTGLALQIGESLRAEPKARALVVGHGGNGAASRAKNAARLVRDEVAKAGISSKRMTTEVVEEPGNRGLNVTVELKLPE